VGGGGVHQRLKRKKTDVPHVNFTGERKSTVRIFIEVVKCKSRGREDIKKEKELHGAKLKKEKKSYNKISDPSMDDRSIQLGAAPKRS